MAFCSLPCWTNFSAALSTFCLLKPNPNAIEVWTPAPFQLLPENPLTDSYTASGPSLPGHSLIGKCSFGQGSLYGWVFRIVWLPRVTERECTSGLLAEPHLKRLHSKPQRRPRPNSPWARVGADGHRPREP